jgi:hypothetical protein
LSTTILKYYLSIPNRRPLIFSFKQTTLLRYSMKTKKRKKQTHKLTPKQGSTPKCLLLTIYTFFFDYSDITCLKLFCYYSSYFFMGFYFIVPNVTSLRTCTFEFKSVVELELQDLRAIWKFWKKNIYEKGIQFLPLRFFCVNMLLYKLLSS